MQQWFEVPASSADCSAATSCNYRSKSKQAFTFQLALNCCAGVSTRQSYFGASSVASWFWAILLVFAPADLLQLQPRCTQVPQSESTKEADYCQHLIEDLDFVAFLHVCSGSCQTSVKGCCAQLPPLSSSAQKTTITRVSQNQWSLDGCSLPCWRHRDLDQSERGRPVMPSSIRRSSLSSVHGYSTAVKTCTISARFGEARACSGFTFSTPSWPQT